MDCAAAAKLHNIYSKPSWDILSGISPAGGAKMKWSELIHETWYFTASILVQSPDDQIQDLDYPKIITIVYLKAAQDPNADETS